MAKRECRGCVEKQAVIDKLIAGLTVRAADQGPSLMQQAAEIAEAETEESREKRLALEAGFSKYRNAFAEVHYRDPYAGCVVVSGKREA